MTEPILEIVKPGLLTTVQDRGRYGFQQYGMVPSGGMDLFALQMANLVVGNERGEGTLEMTWIGPQLLAKKDCQIAICGADLRPAVDGELAPMWRSFILRKGQVLSFEHALSGVRAYVSVAGGLDIPMVMGSRSTYLKAGVGGYEGRALQKGDQLSGRGIIREQLLGMALEPSFIPVYQKEITARVVPGPHLDHFTEEGLHTFLHQIYTLTPQSDRMGFRLKGPAIQHQKGADIISDAIPMGGIQVPANGQPIVLMADRQTTGGYTRIGTVISVDLPLLAQLAPGGTIRFQAISVDEAQTLTINQERLFRLLEIVLSK